MNARERDLLIESALTPVRGQNGGGTDADGALRFHPAWHDLDEPGRNELFLRLQESRAIEAATAADGLTATTRSVLHRLRTAGQ